MDIDISQYMGMYVDGCRENLDIMDKMLLELEQDTNNLNAIQEIFRSAHTLKGMSATMGFEKIAHLTHEMENILDCLRNQQMGANQNVIDVLFETFDILRILVNDSITASDSNVDVEAISRKLSDLTNEPTAPEPNIAESQELSDVPEMAVISEQPSSIQAVSDSPDKIGKNKNENISDINLNEFEIQVLHEASQQGFNIFLLIVNLVSGCLLKAPRAFMVLRNLEELFCEIIKSIPDTKDLEEEKFELFFRLLVVTNQPAKEIKDSIEGISEIERVDFDVCKPEDFKHSVTPKPGSAIKEKAPLPKEQSTPIFSHPKDGKGSTAGSSKLAHDSKKPLVADVSQKQKVQKPPESRMADSYDSKSQAPLSTAGGSSALPANESQPLSADSASTGSKKASNVKPGKSVIAEKRAGQTVRVDMRRLDELMNLMGELVINRTRLADIGAVHKLKDLSETLARVSQITTALQNVVMQVRMVPIEQVFDRFPRMVRDLARKLNKKIDLVLEGKDTEMDRTVIDEIGDPMVHLIRNSIDHGIEAPDVRLAKGKPETGTISLIARHEGNHVIIEVKDDGKGIDGARVAELAVERGLFSREEIEKMSDDEITKIIFLPGFSTSTEVSDLSGRGVGMDTVKSKLDELNGSLDIETKVGEFSRVIIKLPLTLAILQALMVCVGNETYAIPLGAVQETMDITSEDINIIQHQEVTLLRGEVLPIIRLRKVLQVPPIPDEKEKTEDISIVVCSSGEKRAGFMVDELLGQQEIVIKSLGNLLTGLSGIMGATMRGDGTVALIIDIPSFLHMRTVN